MTFVAWEFYSQAAIPQAASADEQARPVNAISPTILAGLIHLWKVSSLVYNDRWQTAGHSSPTSPGEP